MLHLKPSTWGNQRGTRSHQSRGRSWSGSRDGSCNGSRNGSWDGSHNGSWDGTRDRYPRGWEVIEIPNCGDLHQRSSPTLLPLQSLVSNGLNLVCHLSWMILGSWF